MTDKKELIKKLAINGGKPVRSKPMPARALIGKKEKAAAMKVFDEAIASGEAFGYEGKYEKAFIIQCNYIVTFANYSL